MSLTIRSASEQDAAACLGIYAPVVRDTAISFELEPPGLDDMRERIRHALARHDWLIAERGGEVAGYAYATPFRSRAAYQWTAETTVYVAPAHRGCGAGRALYRALLDRLCAKGFRTVLGVIALPNDASEHLHEVTGFRRVGVFHNVGFKHGRWHDTAWWEKDLRPQRL